MDKFVKEMDSLMCDTNRMCDLVNEMIEDAVKAFDTGDIGLAEKAMDLFDHVDRYDVEIEKSAFRILTLYQPLVSDMRAIAATLKCITYLERIAKYSRNIAEAAVYLDEREQYPVKSLIAPMGERAIEMVRTSTSAFMNRTMDGLDTIVDQDDFLDMAMKESLHEIVAFMGTCPESADVCTYYISVLKYLERVGDHACKIAEKVTFMVTGMRTRIN